eukprot:747875-Hanusia_phi.AAC.1
MAPDPVFHQASCSIRSVFGSYRARLGPGLAALRLSQASQGLLATPLSRSPRPLPWLCHSVLPVACRCRVFSGGSLGRFRSSVSGRRFKIATSTFPSGPSPHDSEAQAEVDLLSLSASCCAPLSLGWLSNSHKKPLPSRSLRPLPSFFSPLP